MCAVPGRVIFCISAMLLAPRIFPKFWSIRSLISPSTPTTTNAVYVLIIFFLLLLLFYFILFLFHAELVEEFWTRRQFVRSFKCPLHTIYRRKIKSTGTLRHVLRFLQTTINDSLSKAGKTYSE